MLYFNFWIQRQNKWCLTRSLYVRRIFCRLLCALKSNTGGLSQEIITAVSSPARSLAATPIGWNYFRKELTVVPRGALKLSQWLVGTRGHSPPPIPLPSSVPLPVSAFSPRQSRTTWLALATFEGGGENKTGGQRRQRGLRVRRLLFKVADGQCWDLRVSL